MISPLSKFLTHLKNKNKDKKNVIQEATVETVVVTPNREFYGREIPDILVFDKQFTEDDPKPRCVGAKRWIVNRPLPEKAKGWHDAYHGTTLSKLGSILKHGLVKPGELPNVKVRKHHIQPHSHDNGFTDHIFVTPELRYAFYDSYASPSIVDNTYVRLVLHVKVNPKGINKGKETCSWRMRYSDLFSNKELNEMEWKIKNRDDVIVYAVIVLETKEHNFAHILTLCQ